MSLFGVADSLFEILGPIFPTIE